MKMSENRSIENIKSLFEGEADSNIKELRSVKVSKKIYPTLWLGEKTIYFYGYGRFVQIEYRDGTKETGVERLQVLRYASSLFRETLLEETMGREAIIIGGVEPIVVRVRAILWCVRDRIDDEDFIVPSGVGYKTFVVQGEKINAELVDCEDDVLEFYSPPVVLWIEKTEDTFVAKVLRSFSADC